MNGYSEKDKRHDVYAESRPARAIDDFAETHRRHRDHRHVKAINKRRFRAEELEADPAHDIEVEEQKQANRESARHGGEILALGRSRDGDFGTEGTRGQTPRPLCAGMVGDEGSDPLSP